MAKGSQSVACEHVTRPPTGTVTARMSAGSNGPRTTSELAGGAHWYVIPVGSEYFIENIVKPVQQAYAEHLL